MANSGSSSLPIKKVIRGTFHQGNVNLFGETAGKQCTCCSLFSVAFTLAKHPSRWNSDDLDIIVSEGDSIYKSLHVNNYLSVEDLPRTLDLFSSSLQINYMGQRYGVVNYSSVFPCVIFEHNIQYQAADGMLLLLKGMCISILNSKKNYFLFDSHSKNELGETSADGTSLLLKFSSKRALESHITKNYLEHSDHDIQFELHYVQFIKKDDHLDLSRELNFYKKRLRNKSKTVMAKNRERQATESAKEKCRKRKATNIEKEKCRKRQKSESLKRRCCERNQAYRNCDSVSAAELVRNFKSAISVGPTCICTVCNRSLYRKTVKLLDINRYEPTLHYLFTTEVSPNGKYYVCFTCDKTMISKKSMPCQAVQNKLMLDEIPIEIKKLNRLEKILISKRLLFKKISIMPKGQQPKIKGSVCNVPMTVDAVSKCLPRGSDSNGIILVKLKRKLLFKGYVYFESVRPEFISASLNFLKENNPFYSDILISIDNISKDLLSLSDIEAAIEKDEFPVEIENELLEEDNPQENFQVNCNETITIPNIYSEIDNSLQIAPGENKMPKSFFFDDFCEEQAFPYLLPKGKFGYKVTREVFLSPVKYFNQRLLNFTQRFATNADFIFFAHYVMQQINLFNQISVATSKVNGSFNAGQLRTNYNETVNSFISEDKGYTFMKSVKGSPAYWKNFLHDVLGIVRQFGLPTFFMTLSCADLKWEELPKIISQVNKVDPEDELDYFKKCQLLNQNPVLTARHFQFRVENFFKEIILSKSSPVGKVDHYVIKVEFQFRGSPHIHSFIWLKKPIQLNVDTIQAYVDFIDSVVRADLPDENIEPKLHDLVKTYQIHKHSKSCRKYKNVSCRFNYGRFFTDHTICAIPLPENIPEADKATILLSRKNLLGKVKNYIDTNLDPSKSTYKSDISIKEILQSLEITEQEYYSALSIASGNDFQLHLRRPSDSCFVNNYFAVGLEAWEANLDIQPVFDYYKAVSYMCSYFSKAETESSVAMKKALEDSSSLTFKEKMQKVAMTFLSHRQCSLQEAVYQLMPELWLRKTFPAVTFANTNLPDKRFRICKSSEELEELPDNSTDVFKKNNLDRYVDRPDKNFKGGKFSILDDFCYAEFIAYYVLENKVNIEENVTQPEILIDDLEVNHNNCYPKLIPLMSSKEKMRCRNVKKVIRYHTPNKVTNTEAYAHHLLMLYYPFRNESELSCSETGTYFSKLSNPEVLQIVNANREKYEPWGDLVDEVLLNHVSRPRTDQFAEQENDDVNEQHTVSEDELSDQDVDFQLPRTQDSIQNISSKLDILPDESINDMIASLNTKQREVFNIINSWARKTLANMSALKPIIIDPLQIFLTGGAGTGKSHLIRTIYAALTKIFNFNSQTVDKPKVLLAAPTGIAAVNINGCTIHSALGIPVDCRGLQVPKLSDKKRCSLRIKFESLKAIIIDEISMMSNTMLLHIHQRLLDIFGYAGNSTKPFAGITMILVGDLFQLPPVLQKPVFADYYDEIYNMCHLWRSFKMCELTEVMRQKGDIRFIELLNNVRIGKPTKEDIEVLTSKFIQTSSDNFPSDALHVFAENNPARQHNLFMLEKVKHPLVLVHAIDQVPTGVPDSVYDKILNLSQSQTNGLCFELKLKVGSRVMLTSNVDVSDRLINGQVGIVTNIKFKHDKVDIIYVNFDDSTAGLTRMKSNSGDPNSVPIERISTDIKTNKKDASPIIKRTQFPLSLAWACTVHKVQGLSVEKIVISFDLHKQRSFNHGQMYVALSRVTSLEGLYLIGKYKETAISADPRSVGEYEFLREHQNIDSMINRPSKDTFSIILCNVRSLKTHIVDLKSDMRFTSCNVILCTETQLDSNFCSWDEIKLDTFLDFHCISNHKFSSLSAYCKSTCNFQILFQIDGVAIFQIGYQEMDFKIMLLYRKQDWSLGSFYETLQYLTLSNDVDILTGDFNLTPNEQIASLLTGYVQLVLEPTHIAGSILDHVYIKNSLTTSVMLSLQSVFFSDHEAIKISFK